MKLVDVDPRCVRILDIRLHPLSLNIILSSRMEEPHKKVSQLGTWKQFFEEESSEQAQSSVYRISNCHQN